MSNLRDELAAMMETPEQAAEKKARQDAAEAARVRNEALTAVSHALQFANRVFHEAQLAYTTLLNQSISASMSNNSYSLQVGTKEVFVTRDPSGDSIEVLLKTGSEERYRLVYDAVAGGLVREGSNQKVPLDLEQHFGSLTKKLKP